MPAKGTGVSKVTIKPFRAVYPTPAALITCVSATGRPNIITLGEVFNISLSQPPIVGIAIHKKRYSHLLISESRQFVINMPSEDLLEQTDRCGTCSGRDVDKFAETGDHDLFLGEVQVVHADRSVLDDDGTVAPEKLRAFCFMFNHGHKGEYWSLGRRIGGLWFTRRG